jgi:hypothetical protein
LAVVGLFSRASAQEEVVPILRGEARLGGLPLEEGTVVLHRVAPDFQGEIDSVSVGDGGSFSFRLPYLPDHEARNEIFFASVRFRGLLYFGSAVTDPIHLDSLYTILVYDTASVPPEGIELPLGARNIFLEGDEDGWRVTDVFQLLNEGDRTFFSPSDGRVWSYPLPDGIRDFEVGDSDLPPEAIRLSQGLLEMSAPIPPGERFILVRYRITGDDFVIPAPGQTNRLELLLREPGPEAEFAPLALDTPVEMEPGNVFRRYVGEELGDAMIEAHISPPGWRPRAEWLGILLAGLLAAAGVVALRRTTSGRRRASSEVRKRSREEVLVAIAQLDEEFSRRSSPDSDARRRYDSRREELLAELDQRG